jgi:two-component system sensor kinase FixL
MIRADGAVVWVLDLVRVERVAGEPNTLRGLILDTTKAKKLELSLRESTERFRLLLDSAPDAMLVCREDGIIELANKQAEKTFGYSIKELVGQTVDRLVPEGLRAGHPELRSSYMADPHARPMGVDMELSCVRKDGTEFPVEISLNSFDGSWGKRVVAAIRDVSVRKRNEAALAQHRQELEQSARISTAGELAGSLTHELHQPLTAIVSNAQACLRLLDTGSPHADVLHAALTDIVEEGKRSSRVIRQLRAMLETGETEKVPVDLNELVRTVASLTRGYGLATDVSIELNLAPVLPPVLGNVTQLQQAILNLLMNALESLEGSEGEQRRVMVGTIKTDAQTVEIFVRDHGVGLESETLDRAFDAFFTTKRTGLGMGLSICKSMVEAHGGRVWATRNPDRGTTFHVSLPCSPAGTT